MPVCALVNIIRQRLDRRLQQDVCTVQVVAEPTYPKVMSELLWSHRGQELYLRNPASFNIPIGKLQPLSLVHLSADLVIGQADADKLCPMLRRVLLIV